jgi:hypothetical protein
MDVESVMVHMEGRGGLRAIPHPETSKLSQIQRVRSKRTNIFSTRWNKKFKMKLVCELFSINGRVILYYLQFNFFWRQHYASNIFYSSQKEGRRKKKFLLLLPKKSFFCPIILCLLHFTARCNNAFQSLVLILHWTKFWHQTCLSYQTLDSWKIVRYVQKIYNVILQLITYDLKRYMLTKIEHSHSKYVWILLHIMGIG